MRRLIRNFFAWWNRPVVVACETVSTTPAPPPSAHPGYEVVEVEGSRIVGPPLAALHPITRLPRPAATAAILTQAVAEMHQVAHERYQRAWGPTEPLPANVVQLFPGLAREAIISDEVTVFVADDLPLMDDPYTPSVTWSLATFNALRDAQQHLSTSAWRALRRICKTPKAGMLTLTIYAPPEWCDDDLLIGSVERALRAEITTAIAPVIWARVTPNWVATDAPGWAVSIAAVDDAPLEGVA